LRDPTPQPSRPPGSAAAILSAWRNAEESPALATRIVDIVAWFALLAIAVTAYLTFEDYGLGWDDFTHSQYGQLLLDYYASGFTDKRAFSFVNLYMYGGGFDMAAALAAKVLPFDLFETRRLVGAAVGVSGMFVVWRTARRLGGPVAGLIALCLLATLPMFYGHMFINPKDAPFAVAVAALLYALARAIEEYPRPTAATIAIFGISLGLTLGTRIMGGMVALYVALPLVLLIAHDWRHHDARFALKEFARFVLWLVPGLLLCYAIMAVVWPWSVQEPLNPLRAVEYFSHFFEKPWKEMYDGQAISVPDMPRTYLPTYLGIKLPEILLVLGGLGAIGCLFVSFKRDLPVRRRAAILLIALAFLIPVGITVSLRPAMYNGIRHFLFILPPLCVLGGLAGSWLLQRLADWSPIAALAGAAAILIGLLIPMHEMITLHPYQYAYFNKLFGGVRAADSRYMLDYWGLSFKQATDELLTVLEERGIETPEGRRWVVAVCGPIPIANVELGPDFLLTGNPKGADFALMLGEFYCSELDAPELVKIEREGVVFARVYDIRGRSVKDLNTIPPVINNSN
jgi:4-amino-4-deoxy-L-arabinose transferase-like glycosyltransferase